MKSFEVVVSDVTAPTIIATRDPFVESPGPDVIPPISVNFIGNVVASDAVDGDIVPICTPESGSGFDWGNTPVTCVATDASGNSSSVSFDVLVDFPYDIDLIVPKGRAEAGSTVSRPVTSTVSASRMVRLDTDTVRAVYA